MAIQRGAQRVDLALLAGRRQASYDVVRVEHCPDKTGQRTGL
jgi:hypothetical protein